MDIGIAGFRRSRIDTPGGREFWQSDYDPEKVGCRFRGCCGVAGNGVCRVQKCHFSS